jgi:hypothetical protein
VRADKPILAKKPKAPELHRRRISYIKATPAKFLWFRKRRKSQRKHAFQLLFS